jgi:hypothetical protein
VAAASKTGVEPSTRARFPNTLARPTLDRFQN